MSTEVVRGPVLNIMGRVSGMLFVLFIAPTFLGAFSVSDGGRSHQIGPFARTTFGSCAIGALWCNPGSSEQIVVGSIDATYGFCA